MLYTLKVWLLDDFSIPTAIIYSLMEKTLLSWLGSAFYIYKNSNTQFNELFYIHSIDIFLKEVILCRKISLKFLAQGWNYLDYFTLSLW